MSDELRKAFEAHFDIVGAKFADGYYSDPATDILWNGFQAGHALAQQDAARYHWLRERVYKDGGELHCQGPNVDRFAYGHTGEMLDAAIDAAMKGSK